MGSLKDAIELPPEEWASFHGDAEKALKKFIIPLLERSKYYDRMTGYFSLDAFYLASRGIHAILSSGGEMRLIMGVHDLKHKVIEAQQVSRESVEKELVLYLNEVIKDIHTFEEEFKNNDVRVLASLLRTGKLKIKLAVPRKTYLGQSGGIFHTKLFIFRDGINVVTANGSPNETSGGINANGERLEFNRSWIDGDAWHIRDAVRDFEELWTNPTTSDFFVFDLPEVIERRLHEVFGNRDGKKKSCTKRDDTQRVALIRAVEALRNHPDFWIDSLGPIYLFPHQIGIIQQATRRVPVRILIADEVGLGKTLSAGGVVARLMRMGLTRRFIVLAPSNLVQQWQMEMKQNFGIETSAYLSNKGGWISSDGRCVKISPNIYDCPDNNLIISWHLARRDIPKFKECFRDYETIIIDEAHNARLKSTTRGLEPTKLFELVKEIRFSFRDVILLTATPFQTDISEIYGLMYLLGLEGPYWSSLRNFSTYYQVLDASSTNPRDLCDALVGLREFCINFFDRDELLDVISGIEGPLFGQELVEDKMRCFERLIYSEQKEVVPLLIKYPQDMLRLLGLFNPIQHLMLRNTRSNLAEAEKDAIDKIYVFPRRKIEDYKLSDCLMADKLEEINSIRELLNEYLKKHMKKTLSYIGNSSIVGFISSVYQQRLASSLLSAYVSLGNRRENLARILELVDNQRTRMQHTYGNEAIWSGSVQSESEGQDQSDTDMECDDSSLDAMGLRNISKELGMSTLPNEDEAKDERAVSDSYVRIGKAIYEGNLNLRRAVESEIKVIEDLQSRLEIFYQNPDLDPKIAVVLKLIASYGQEEGCSGRRKKVIVFSKFLDSIDAITKAVMNTRDVSWRIGRYTGNGCEILQSKKDRGWTTSDKEQIVRMLDTDQLDVLLCTDAASEGINLQSASIEINLDVPWNPARLEQRIGRIDRLGQREKEVKICYVWYPDQESIEYRMIEALVNRTNLSRMTIGPTSDVISESLQRATVGEIDVGVAIRDAIKMMESVEGTPLAAMKRAVMTNRASMAGANGHYLDLNIHIVNALAEVTGWTIERDGYNGIISVQSKNVDGNLITIASASTVPGRKNYLTITNPLIDRLLQHARAKMGDRNLIQMESSFKLMVHPIGPCSIEIRDGIYEECGLPCVIGILKSILSKTEVAIQ